MRRLRRTRTETDAHAVLLQALAPVEKDPFEDERLHAQRVLSGLSRYCWFLFIFIIMTRWVTQSPPATTLTSGQAFPQARCDFLATVPARTGHRLSR